MPTEATIYIPTYRRVGAQVTWSYLSPRWRNRAFLVARPDEIEALRGDYPVLECPVTGINRTRQWLLDQHDTDIFGPHVFMMDDDLRFFKRRTDEPAKFEPKESFTDGKFDDMMSDLLDLFDHHELIGLADRGGANRVTDRVRYNSRMFDVLGINLDVMRENGFRIDRMRFMEDFDFQLQFITNGYGTAMLNSYVKYDYSQKEGGCDTYRDSEGQRTAALDLALEWPEFVKTREVNAKSDDGMWGTRTDVTIQWQKAAKKGLL